ncbi:MAG: TetR/AcrR family transcriptional regulator [Bacilli bacterium]|nr:TetR/AcrR family transcriptional regulator [Bacilli bacterium]
MGIKDAKVGFVLKVAEDLFMIRGISDVAIKDIADEAGIGEATVYRYFKNKNNIIIQCAMNLGESTFEDYFDLSKAKTGYEKLDIFYNAYLKTFRKKPSNFYFIKEFDSYMSSHSEAPLEEYENGLIHTFQDIFMDAYNLGLKDGTVKEINDIQTFYFSTTHSLLELCKKLSMKKDILEQDKALKKSSEIKCLVNIILEYIKK